MSAWRVISMAVTSMCWVVVPWLFVVSMQREEQPVLTHTLTCRHHFTHREQCLIIWTARACFLLAMKPWSSSEPVFLKFAVLPLFFLHLLMSGIVVGSCIPLRLLGRDTGQHRLGSCRAKYYTVHKEKQSQWLLVGERVREQINW